MRPFLLPIFFYAGQVNAAAESTSLSSSQLVAVAEMRALLVWILLQLRIINRDQVLLAFVCHGNVDDRDCLEQPKHLQADNDGFTVCSRLLLPAVTLS